MTPLAGMKTARLSMYDVSATLICSGETSNERAIAGSAVARMVPSSCSMNIALAMIRATVRKPGAVVIPVGMAREALILRLAAAYVEAERAPCCRFRSLRNTRAWPLSGSVKRNSRANSRNGSSNPSITSRNTG